MEIEALRLEISVVGRSKNNKNTLLFSKSINKSSKIAKRESNSLSNLDQPEFSNSCLYFYRQEMEFNVGAIMPNS